MEGRKLRRSLAVWGEGWIPTDDSPYLLPRKLADALDTIRIYRQLRTVIYTDGSAVGGVKHGGSSAVVTSGDPGNTPSGMSGTSADLSTQPLLRLRCGGYGWHLTALTMRLLLLES
jgi:hypothetical protein